ncbi:MAG: hypothetical protein O2782_05340 [bacterium]|nr:hypothetical protein [bacterium]
MEGSSEQNRRFGLAALAANRRSPAGGANPVARFAANLTQRYSVSDRASDRASDTVSALQSEPSTIVPIADTIALPAAQDSIEVESAPQTTVAAAAAATRAVADRRAAAAAEQTPIQPVSTLTNVEARSERVTIGLAAIASASRRSSVQRTNRVQDGQSLSALRDTSSGIQQFSSGITQADGGRRSTSLFDLPSSGQGLVTRLRAQVRPSSPLNALRSSDTSDTSPSSGLSSLSSLTAANAQRAGLQSNLRSNDRSSRSLLSAANPNRTAGGFGLSTLNRSAFDLIG